jgi:splicing factor 3A subunit 1
LNFGDPYHTYYQHKIKEIKENVSQEKNNSLFALPKPAPQLVTVIEPEIPKEPPPDWEFMVDPPNISRRHLDIVKLTAQFVARNGAHFMDQLMMREQKNEMFDFLRRNHILFTYFTKLVEQYSKILMPSYVQLEKLRQLVGHPLGMKDYMSQVEMRVVWEKYQNKEKMKAEEQAEKERVEYAQIDWHDFVVVETINFREDEAGYLPPPIQPSQLATRLLQQQKFDKQQEENEVEEIEMELDDEPMEDVVTTTQPDPKPSVTPTVPSLPSVSTNIKIRRDYNPKAAQAPPPVSAANKFVSPITGEKVPAAKLDEHLRYGLLDPRWVEDRKKKIEERQQEEEVFAEGLNVATNIKGLAKKRTDIFGMHETVIGREIGEENRPRPAPVQWDGFSATIDKTRQLAQDKVTVEEQLQYIQRVHGQMVDPTLEKIGPQVPGFKPQPAPPPPIHRQPLPPQMIPPPQQMPRPLLPTPAMHGFVPGAPPLFSPFIHPAPPVEPPMAKRVRSEMDDFIPEEDFIKSNPGSVTFTVLVPHAPDRSEWPLHGQSLSINLPITDSISVIKSKIADELGLPPSKQKLQLGVRFI